MLRVNAKKQTKFRRYDVLHHNLLRSRKIYVLYNCNFKRSHDCLYTMLYTSWISLLFLRMNITPKKKF